MCILVASTLHTSQLHFLLTLPWCMFSPFLRFGPVYELSVGTQARYHAETSVNAALLVATYPICPRCSSVDLPQLVLLSIGLAKQPSRVGQPDLRQ